MKLDPQSSVPLFQQIAAAIEGQILTGELHAGDFIPSVRDLALTLVVNPNTVAKAYQHLQTMKLVTLERGKGLRVVRIHAPLVDSRRHALLAAKVEELLTFAFTLGFSRQDVVKLVESPHDRGHRT